MKGTWVNSARNINYNGNTVTCELQNMNGAWVKNTHRFFQDLIYANKDGHFTWTNYKNNIDFKDISHEAICKRYKQITIQQCLDNLTPNYDSWFSIENVIKNVIKPNCISISLFKKNPDNTYYDEYPVNASWREKYYKSLIKNLDSFTLDDFCVDLYLANDLQDLLPELQKYPFLNIIVMKSTSVGAQPGTLWRFMNITNKSYKTVYIADIDEPWTWIPQWQKYNNKLVTLTPSDILISKETTAYNFPTLMGGHTKVNPSLFTFDIVAVMKGFLELVDKRTRSKNPFCFDDEDPITVWNQPIGEHKFGWGRLQTKYGFDEFFLKHVIYYEVYTDLMFIQ